MRSVAAVVALAACLHAGLWASLRDTATPAPINSFTSVSYSPFQGARDNADAAPIPTPEQVRADLTAIRPYAAAVRTYRSTRGMEAVPEIAADLDMKVTLGIYLDTNLTRDGNYDLVADPDDPDKRITRNELEIRTGMKLARRYSGTVNALVVGNETTLRRSMVEATEADQAYEAFTHPGSHENPVTHQKMTYSDFRAAFSAIKKEWDDGMRDEAAKQHRTVEDIKAEWNVGELMKVIQRVKRQLGQNTPVTTGETWDIWVKYPKLATSQRISCPIGTKPPTRTRSITRWTSSTIRCRRPCRANASSSPSSAGRARATTVAPRSPASSSRRRCCAIS
jgi:exo-beta-1,3-glucanase (GH17 family)